MTYICTELVLKLISNEQRQTDAEIHCLWTLQLKLQLTSNQLSHVNGLMRSVFCIILYACVSVYLHCKLLL